MWKPVRAGTRGGPGSVPMRQTLGIRVGAAGAAIPGRGHGHDAGRGEMRKRASAAHPSLFGTPASRTDNP